jgi:hypothetical protein|tara:strand:- start:17768 stop:18793 length:1026 start_codon:yes stop_codon:yes gene_type:complete
MGKSSGGGGDASAAAQVEGEFGIDAARNATYADRVNQSNPLGQNSWSNYETIDPSTGETVTAWRNDTSLNGGLQQTLNTEIDTDAELSQQANDMNSTVRESMSSPLNFDQFGEGASGPDATYTQANARETTRGPVGDTLDNTTGGEQFTWDSSNRGRAEDDAYGRSTARLDPQFAKKRADMERTMAGRGLRAGDSAYDSAMQNFDRGSNDAYEMARMGATSEGRSEDQQSFGQAKDAWGTNRDTEQQRFNQSQAGNVNTRQADQQDFNQRTQAGDQAFAQNLQGNAQNFDQGTQATDSANALRSQQIEEYLGKRNLPLQEQNALRQSMNTGELISSFGDGG